MKEQKIRLSMELTNEEFDNFMKIIQYVQRGADLVEDYDLKYICAQLEYKIISSVIVEE